MRQSINFLCLSCGQVKVVQLTQAIILKGESRCYFPPAGWAMLYPTQDFPARSGICDKCITKVIDVAKPK